MLVGVVGAQKVVHASLGSCSQPAQGADFVHAHLSTLDDNRAVVDEGLNHRHSAIVEIASVRVIGGAAEQFDVEGSNASRGFFAGFQAESFEKLGSLNNADAKVIKGGVIIDIRGLGDQAVIRNDKHARIMSLLEH